MGLINELFSPGCKGFGESGAGIREDWVSWGSCNGLVIFDIGGFGEVGDGVWGGRVSWAVFNGLITPNRGGFGEVGDGV